MAFDQLSKLFLINFFILNILIFISIKFAFYFKFMDKPNKRSLHLKSTPNIGGLPVTLLFFLNLLYLYSSTISINEIIFITMLFIISLVGLIDDLFKLSSLIRFFFQILVSLISVIIIFYFTELNFNQYIYYNFLFIFFISIFFIILLTNIFNFMDGINGLVITKSIMFLISMIFFLNMDDAFIPIEFKNFINFTIIILILILIFLPWNFPFAKIFMGDSLSYFLGFFISFLIILVSLIDIKYLWVSLTLLSLFIVDTCLTILFRLSKKINIFKAHKTHAYQIVAEHFNSHFIVTIYQILFFIIILFPLSYLIVSNILNGLISVIIIYLIISIKYYLINKFKLTK